MAIKAANREPCTPPRSTLILTPAFVVYTELGIDPRGTVGRVQSAPSPAPSVSSVPCIIVHRISQLNPHVLIQSMGISFCIYRLISCQNIDYNYPIWDISARRGLLGVILPNSGSRSPPLFSLHMTVFRGRNQRFIMECTLLWTIAGYRPQCEVSSKVSQNSVSLRDRSSISPVRS